MKKKTKRGVSTHSLQSQKTQIPFQNYFFKTPVISAYFLYLEEERWKSVRDQPECSMYQIIQQASTNWQKNLSNEQRNVYAEKAKQIKNESDAKEYLKMLEQTYTIKKKIQKEKVKQKPQSKNKK
ncbi:unnamed protein product [Paramecium primaurelia]|uniref:HMG box domain-containing protein n=1 Tax=Paramecium primaurelia TaxID=5886 RepID=A0A8S1K6P9_PARPR|nr:unnamed protein product [Paramecium primaurelia]